MFCRDTVVGPYFYQLVDYIKSDTTNGSRITPIPSAIKIRSSSDTASLSDGQAAQPWGFDVPEKNVAEIQTPCLITIEGLPSPSCVAYIGSKYRLRPEYWLGNLSLGRQSLNQGDFFELPNLPSRRGNVVQVSIPILGRRTGSTYVTHISAVERLQAKQKIEDWDRQLFHGKKFGSTRLRKLHMHNSQFFSIEQLVSFTVCPRKDLKGWIGKGPISLLMLYGKC